MGSVYASIITPSRVAMGKEQLRRFEAALDALDPISKEVLTLAKLAGLKRSDVAEQLGISLKEVDNRLYRAKVRLDWVLMDED